MKQKNTTSNIFMYIAIFATILLMSAFNVNAAQSAVNLGTAGNFVILSKSGVSTTGTTSIVGDIGLSPAAATFITGFGLISDASNTFATSSLVTGKIYAADYTPPTPTAMGVAIGDMEIAYTDAAGRTLPDYTELGAGNIGGMTLTPGLYKWGTGVTIPTDVTLSGSSTDVWIFQIAQTLDIANGKKVILSGGAQAKNIFWQVAGQATLGTTSDFKGNILGQTAIVLNTGATLNGRALAQTAVTLDANAVTIPSGSSTPNPTPTPTPTPGTGSGSSGGTSSGSGSSSSGGSTSGSSNTLECTEWSACNSKNISTRTCKYTTGDTVLTKTQACTLNQTTAPKQNVTTPVTNTSNNGQNTWTVNQSTPASQNNTNNNENTQAGGTTQSGSKNSWWENFLAWVSRLFGGK
jgi:hypothetical protein